MNGNCSVSFERMAFCAEDFTLFTPISCSFSSNLSKNHTLLVQGSLLFTAGKKLTLYIKQHEHIQLPYFVVRKFRLQSINFKVTNKENITISIQACTL